MTAMKPYFRGIEMYNDALIVKVEYPNSWDIYPSDDGRINVAPSETEDRLFFYYADSSNATYEDMFDLIESTIKENNEALMKLQLLKEKVEELKEIFSSTSYDELCGLQFSFQKKGKSNGSKTKRKTKPTTTKVEDTNNTNIIENTSEDASEETGTLE